MNNRDSNFIHGVFCYDYISLDIFSTKLEVQDMSDEDLVDEIYHLFLHDNRADDIIQNYYNNEEVNEVDREYLINIYLLVRGEEGLHYD